MSVLIASSGLLFHAGALGADSSGCHKAVGKDFQPASPSGVGTSAAPLLALNAALDAGTYDIRSLLIVRDCALVFERYKEGVGREHNHALYSVTKSVTATLAGALLMQRKLRSLDVAISEVMSKPERIGEDDWRKAQRITLKSVMQMSSGLAYTHNPARHPIYALTVDRFAMALSPELIAAPGARFNYSDGDVSITGAVVAAAADKHLYELAKEVLFEPLQMSNYDWWFKDSVGRYPGGWGLRLRPMDMAKVGQLYLQNGEWNGRRVFGADFRDVAWTSGVNRSYGLHWWIRRTPGARSLPYFFAEGFKGQRIFVVPTLRLVAVLTASVPSPEMREVDGLLVGALVDAFDQRSAAGSSSSLTALSEIQKKGFRGETRIHQTKQDTPL